MASILLILAVSTTAGFAFAKLRYRGSGTVFLAVVAALMVPLQSIIIPEYVNLGKLGLINTYLGAILVYVALGTPFATFLMATYYRGISDDLIEAAVMDGLGYERTFLRIALPLSWPAIATVTVLQFIQIWDDLLVGLLFLQNPQQRTITVGLAALSAGRTTSIPVLMAGSFLSRGAGDRGLPDLPALPGARADPGDGQVMTADWEVVAPAGAELGERPFWDAATGTLCWVDIHAGPCTGTGPGPGSTRCTSRPGCRSARPRPAAAAATCWRPRTGSGWPARTPGRAGPPLRPPGMAEDVRFNDGACDPAGRFWAGTVAADRRPGGGALYRLDPGGRITLVLDGVTESNGLGWSPDGGTMYYIDSGEPSPRIRAFGFDAAAGSLGPSRDLLTVPAGLGIPDGLVVDAAGGLWVAFWGGSAVRRYSPDGELLAELPVPVSQPSCPAFGGAGLTDLYVTTAWEGMTPAQRAADPLAGHLLRTRVEGVAGQPVAAFAG